jgi:3-methyladenine DNA glycosylase AlkD
VHRFFGDELIVNHAGAREAITEADVQALGDGMSSWDQVDCFALYIAGPSWRRGLIADDTILAWACSNDRWWRRAAVVSTVPLNVRAHGGRGDVSRTLAICGLLKTDRDDMVVKAMSWALRALAVRDATAVRAFLIANHGSLAPRITREVENKLQTGLKRPKRELGARPTSRALGVGRG